MQPIEKKSSESGLTLVELTISLAIVTLIAAAGYAMLVRTQKYAAQKRVSVSTQTELDQLLGIIKKNWEYRTNEVTPGIPPSGHSMLTTANTSCGPGTTTFCPKLRLWMRRNISGTSIMDVVTIENICVRPTDKSIRTLVTTLNPLGQINANMTCSTCPKGDIPAVKIQGLDMKTGAIVLPSENRLFPQNAANADAINTNGILGMQACFTQALNQSPISVYLRALYLDQSEKSLKLIQKTQVYPFENFARIRLEQ
jgi:prepilin-type N-terminal cleavage/methylation domain-containing protein